MLREEELLQVWYGDRPPGLLLRALEVFYRGALAVHRMAWRSGLRRVQRLPVPVLVVGNLTAGGTGKTPLVLALAAFLRSRGRKPGIVSRGFGGSERGPALLPEAAEAERFGDEPALMRASGCPLVAIGRDRAAAGRLLVQAGADVIIADDGLQHRRLGRDLEICVIDGVRRFGNGRLLPAGPLREPVARLAEVDWRVCNGGVPEAGEVPMQLVPGEAVRLRDGRSRALADFAGEDVQAVAGIGNPARFFAMLRVCGLRPHEHAFPDHHAYRPEDLPFAAAGPVLLTDKDAVKLGGAEFAEIDLWRVPVQARLPESFFRELEARLAGAADSRVP